MKELKDILTMEFMNGISKKNQKPYNAIKIVFPNKMSKLVFVNDMELAYLKSELEKK